MPGLNKNRTRSHIMNFRVTNEEKIAIEEKIKVYGLKKSEFFLNSCFDNAFNIIGGKYGSDRLSVQIENMNTILKNAGSIYEKNVCIIKNYSEEIKLITKRLSELNESIIDLQKENLDNQKIILECKSFVEELLKIMEMEDKENEQ